MGAIGFWRRLTHGLRVLADRESADQELSDELTYYLDQATAEHIARGLSPEQARRAARLEVGNLTVVREEVRSSGWESAIGSLLADVRYGARRLRRSPGFTAVSVITLALGLGASTAIFSAVNGILLEALPYPHPERVAMIADVGQDGSPADVTFGTYRELLQRTREFEAMAAFKAWQPTMIGDPEPERVAGQRVSASYFRTLGVVPVLGRDFQESEDRVNGPKVVILSDGLWRRRFGADQGIIGRPIKLDDTDYQVVGVMPSGFANVLAPSSEVWAPLQYATVFGPDSREWGHHLRLVARLRAGIGLEGARRELALLARTPVPEFARVPWASLKSGLIVTSLQADVTRGVRPALLAVLGAVLLVLAIASVNVTNLLLARGAQQRGEFAMRAALGAGRTRLVRQLLTESVLLALIGSAVGMVVALGGVRALVALSPPGLPRVDAIRLDGAVFTFSLVVTTVIGLLVGIVPALQASRGDLQIGLQHSSRRTAGGHNATRGTLVVAEVAVALVLLVAAGLVVRSIRRVLTSPVGFDSANLLTMQVQTSGPRFAADSAGIRLYSTVLDAVRGVPGVAAAAFTSQLPLSGDLDGYGVHFEDESDPNDVGSALRYAVTPGYFEAMRIPLRRGRFIDTRDGPDAPRAAIVNESFAKRVFGDRDPIGRRLKLGPDDGSWSTIVGLVGDVKQSSLELDQPNAVYVSSTQWQWVDNLMSLVVRTRGDAGALAPAVRRAIWSVDRDRPILRVATMEGLVARSVADRHFAMILFDAFGLVALVLAATGLYGVLSGSVTERTREIGVRSALGASSGEIVGLVLRQGMALTVGGVSLGLLGAAVATRAVTSLLFGVSRLDPVTYLSVIALLGVAAVIACSLPALRASRVDPARTLRAD